MYKSQSPREAIGKATEKQKRETKTKEKLLCGDLRVG
jgi:hypothetical protein